VGGALGESLLELIYLSLALAKYDPYLIWFHDRFHKLGNVYRQSDRISGHAGDLEHVIADLRLEGGRSHNLRAIRESCLQKKALLETDRKTASHVNLLHWKRGKCFDLCKLGSERCLTENLMSLVNHKTYGSLFFPMPMTTKGFISFPNFL